MNPVRTGFFDSLAIKNIVKIDFFQYCVGSVYLVFYRQANRYNAQTGTKGKEAF